MTEAFVVAGAQRAGTTFLYHLLDAHPAIEMARPLRPEPKFFLRADSPTRQEHGRLFGRKPGARWRGEKSTSYMEHPEVVERIEAFQPGCRFLFLLRDPVERAISHYWFSVANGVETLAMEEAFRREPERGTAFSRDRFSVSPFAYLSRGEYARLLAPFAAVLPRERLAIAVFEHILDSPRELGRVLSFLGLPAADAEGLFPAVGVPNRAARGSRLPAAMRERLRERYAEPNRLLADRFGLDLSPWEEAGPAAESAPRLFFIVGRGRSGTTVLRRMLQANPAVFVPPEALFVINLRRRYARGPWDDHRVRAFARDLWLEDRLRRWGLAPEEVERRLLAVPAPRRELWRLCLEVYAAAAAAAGKPEVALVGDKNPHHALFVGQLGSLFPQARFVHLVRDYRDNVASYRGVRFDLKGVPALARRWVRYNRAVLDAAQAAPGRFHLLRYEDLLADPASRLVALCDFLQIPFDEAMLDAIVGVEDEGASRPDDPRRPVAGGTAQEAALAWHANLRRPLDPGQAGKWRRSLSPAQVRAADAICQPLGERLGYSPTGPTSTTIGGIPGRLAADLVTCLERTLFRLPLGLRVAVIRGFRRATGNVIR